MFPHFPGAHSRRECRECGVMYSTELLPQFPLPQQGRQLMLQWLSRQTQPCSSSLFNHGQHLDPPVPSSHSCSLLMPPGTSFAWQFISISARHVCGSSLCQARRIWELPGSRAKSSSPDESPAIRSVPGRAASPLGPCHMGHQYEQLLSRGPVGCAQFLPGK